MRTTRVRKPLSLRLLAAGVGLLLLAVPVLGLNCELACARMATRAAKIDGAEAPSKLCASHTDGAPRRPSGGPPNPERCGHRADSVAVKRVADDAAPRFVTSILAEPVEVRTACAIDRSAGSSALREAAAPLPTPAPSSVLRL